MDAERAREFMLTLPHVVETMQWGDNLVFWAGDKAVGGKMFALVDLEGQGAVASFSAGQEHAAELYEREGVVPAPYLARAHWVAVERWDVLTAREWEAELRAAYEVVLAKLPRRTQQVLALPAKERAKVIAERRALLASEAHVEDEKASTARGLAAKKVPTSAKRKGLLER